MDHLYTLNDVTPKIKCQDRNGVDPNLIFGLQSKLFLLSDSEKKESEVEHDEVETVTILGGDSEGIEQETLIEALHSLPRESVWRAKGFIKLRDGRWVIVNWAFGRYELKDIFDVDMTGMTVMGGRGEVRGPAGRFAEMIGSVLSHPHLDNHMEECN
jgi:G3E family GTPase